MSLQAGVNDHAAARAQHDRRDVSVLGIAVWRSARTSACASSWMSTLARPLGVSPASTRVPNSSLRASRNLRQAPVETHELANCAGLGHL
jgi:hypothetical protein